MPGHQQRLPTRTSSKAPSVTRLHFGPAPSRRPDVSNSDRTQAAFGQLNETGAERAPSDFWGHALEEQVENEPSEIRIEDFEHEIDLDDEQLNQLVELLEPATLHQLIADFAPQFQDGELEQALGEVDFLRSEIGPAPAGLGEAVRFHPGPARSQPATERIPDSRSGVLREAAEGAAGSCTLGTNVNAVSTPTDLYSEVAAAAYGGLEGARGTAYADDRLGSLEMRGLRAGNIGHSVSSAFGMGVSLNQARQGLRSDAQSDAVRRVDHREGRMDAMRAVGQGGLAAARWATKNSPGVSLASSAITGAEALYTTVDASRQQTAAVGLRRELDGMRAVGPGAARLEDLSLLQARAIAVYIIRKKGLSKARNGSGAFAAALSCTAALIGLFASGGAALPLVAAGLAASGMGTTAMVEAQKVHRLGEKREDTRELLGPDAPSRFASSATIGQRRDEQLMSELEGQDLTPVERELAMAVGNPLRERLHMAKAILALVDEDPAENSTGMKLLRVIGQESLVLEVLEEETTVRPLVENGDLVGKIKEALKST